MISKIQNIGNSIGQMTQFLQLIITRGKSEGKSID